jgi:hypothetical protein
MAGEQETTSAVVEPEVTTEQQRAVPLTTS